MGLFEQWPYTNLHTLNLDWILESLKELEHTIEQFVSINALKYADPIQWNITRQYEKNTIVIDPLTGTAYISVQPVPAGVALTRDEYWTVVFDLGSFVVRAAKNFTNRWEEDTTLTATFNTAAGEWLVWGDTLYKALVNITAGDSYVIDSNIRHFTIEEYGGHLEDLQTTAKNNLVAAINEVLQTLTDTVGDLADLNTTDKSNVVAAINEVLQSLTDTVGDLADLTTTDKSNVVAAINEVNFIVENVTFNIPADYADANAVMTYLADKKVGDNVVIKYADGTYYGNQLDLYNKDYHNITIEGNTSNPLAVTINLGNDNSVAFMTHHATIGKIDGFNIIGTARVETGNVVSWGSTIYQMGFFAYSSKMYIGKHNVCNGVYYGIGAQKESEIYVDYGDAITEADANNIIANYTTWIGKGFIVNNAGDVGIHAYENSYVEAVNSISLNAADDDRNLGFCYYAEASSTMDIRGIVASGAHEAGIRSSGGSDVVGWGLFAIDNNIGAQSADNGAMQLYDSILDNNAIGAQAITNGSISSGGCTSKNNTYDGYSALSGGCFNFTRAAYANNNGHAGLYWDDKATIKDISNLSGSGNTWGLVSSIFDNFLDIPPVADHADPGNYIFRKNPSSFFGYFCRDAGTPGTWAPFGLALINDVRNMDLNDAPLGMLSVDQSDNGTVSNIPYTGNHNYVILTFGFFMGDSRMQIAFCDDGHIAIRNRWSGTWTAWNEAGSPV